MTVHTSKNSMRFSSGKFGANHLPQVTTRSTLGLFVLFVVAAAAVAVLCVLMENGHSGN